MKMRKHPVSVAIWIRGTLIVLPTLIVAGSAFAQGSAGEQPIGMSLLPRDLSPWGMFMSADIVVKAVMVGLVVASVVTWTVWLAKTIELVKARRHVRAAVDALGSIQTLANTKVSNLTLR